MIRFPKTFSFIDQPEEALEVIESLVAHTLSRKVKRLRFDQSDCELTDLCANAVVGVLANEARERVRKRVSGRFPTDPLQARIAAASGLPKFAGVKYEADGDFLTLGLIRGRYGREHARKSSRRELVATQVTRYVNACLDRYGRRLSREGARFLSSIVGEVIGNAEDHSGTLNWWVAGYLHHESDASYGDCHLTIFNFGRTLAQTLASLPPDSLLRQRIDRLVDIHTTKGWFRLGWNREALWTLYALQEAVSRHQRDPAKLTDRGQGTADLITFFQELGQSDAAASEPRMCIVSGRTHILFDNTYLMALQPTDTGKDRRIIALNDSNQLEEPPNPKFVRTLRRYFPGTLISLRFFLDEEHLRKVRRTL